MSLKGNLFFLGFCLVVIGPSQSTNAGPYFNTAATEIDSQSRSAVKELSDARIELIQMFSELDAGRVDRANEARSRAIKLLDQAHSDFKEIEAKVPAQPLKFSVRSEDEKQILDAFANALASRKLAFPKTEKELAFLAITIVGNYLTTVQKADLRGFPKNWMGVRAIILSEIDLLTVGNLVSVVWIIRG